MTERGESAGAGHRSARVSVADWVVDFDSAGPAVWVDQAMAYRTAPRRDVGPAGGLLTLGGNLPRVLLRRSGPGARGRPG